jgi:hypothetical protein
MSSWLLKIRPQTNRQPQNKQEALGPTQGKEGSRLHEPGCRARGPDARRGGSCHTPCPLPPTRAKAGGAQVDSAMRIGALFFLGAQTALCKASGLCAEASRA